MNNGPAKRWGFKRRLTALIAVVFICGGAALLGVQYLLTQRLFESAMGTMTACVGSAGSAPEDGGYPAAECFSITDGSTLEALPETVAVEVTTTADPGLVLEQTATLSRDVLSRLLLWSVVTLVAFTVVAVIAASWLSGRSFARIGQITRMTRQITTDDLSRRLELPGPSDEIKELGDTIDTMLDRLQAAFTQQQRFIMNASHELRTPLTTTRAALEIPMAQGRVPAELEPSIRKALAANERSEAIIAALLALARVGNHKGRGDRRGRDDRQEEGNSAELVDLAELAETVLAERLPAAQAKQITVSRALTQAPLVHTDAVLLGLAVGNLIDNAIEHNVPAGRVHISSGSSDDHSWFEVANTGLRISEEESQRLTEPFNRGPGTRIAGNERGLGLGLALVESIAASMDATLSIVPGASGGLRVRLDFSR